MIDLFVQFNPGYTHGEAEEMPHRKMLHYLTRRIASGARLPQGGPV